MPDPITAVGLAHSCLQLATAAASTAKKIYQLVEKLKETNKTAQLLASQMDLIGLVLSELQAWLNHEPSLSPSAKVKLASALQSCGVIVTDISISVQKALPPPWELAPSILQRIEHVWSEDLIRQQREMISTSLQAFQLIFSLTSLYVSISFPANS